MPTSKRERTVVLKPNEVILPPEPKTGLLTTEFMLAIAVLLISGAMVMVSKNLGSDEWLDFAKWIVGGYAVSRGLAKVRL